MCPDTDGSELSPSPDTLRPTTEMKKEEVLLTHYRELRQQVREKMSQKQKRESRGVASVGLIVAYAFYTGDLILVGFVPLIIGIIGIQHMESTSWVVRLTAHIVTIQDEIPVDKFSWESTYGMHSDNNTIESLPRIAVAALIGLVYFGSISVSLYTASNVEVLNRGVGHWLVYTSMLAIYVLLTLLLGVSLYSYRRTCKENDVPVFG